MMGGTVVVIAALALWPPLPVCIGRGELANRPPPLPTPLAFVRPPPNWLPDLSFAPEPTGRDVVVPPNADGIGGVVRRVDCDPPRVVVALVRPGVAAAFGSLVEEAVADEVVAVGDGVIAEGVGVVAALLLRLLGRVTLARL